jgi:hypothetical protein
MSILGQLYQSFLHSSSKQKLEYREISKRLRLLPTFSSGGVMFHYFSITKGSSPFVKSEAICVIKFIDNKIIDY